MQIKELNKRPDLDPESKLHAAYLQFGGLLDELKKKALTEEVTRAVNDGIDQINALSTSGGELKKQIEKTQSTLLKQIEKELKIVPQNYYRNTWMALGMAAFGVPLGVAFGVSLGNMAFLAIGLPIGMAIGLAIGAGMDKKAFDEGRQLDLEIK